MSLDKFSAKGRSSLGRKIEKTAQNLIGHFDPEAKTMVEGEEETWRINIETTFARILIGRHGQTLQALEHILRLMLGQESGEYPTIILDIGGYRAALEQEITTRAREAAERVLASGESEELPAMNAFARRLVHLSLAEIKGIETESTGEEPERRIVIRKTEK